MPGQKTATEKERQALSRRWLQRQLAEGRHVEEARRKFVDLCHEIAEIDPTQWEGDEEAMVHATVAKLWQQ